MSIDVGLLIAAVGCVAGVAGFIINRDKGTVESAEWRGSVNAKLDVIVGIKSEVEDLREGLIHQGERIAKVESSAQQAHKRLDEHLKKE